MIVNVAYALAALHETAKFIWENNPSVKNWPSEPKSVFDVMLDIKGFIRRQALQNAKTIVKEKVLKKSFDDEWISYSGTGGYYAIFMLDIDPTDDEITISVEILVDTAVGNPEKGYITELVDKIEVGV